jgi:hypothetical protein
MLLCTWADTHCCFGPVQQQGRLGSGWQPTRRTGEELPWRGEVAAPVDFGGEGSGERVVERVGSAGIRYGVHWGQETHRGVVLHCGGRRPEGNDMESIVRWWWRLARGSERCAEHRRCSWWRRRGDSMAGGAGRCGSALGGDGGMQESRGGEWGAMRQNRDASL